MIASIPVSTVELFPWRWMCSFTLHHCSSSCWRYTGFARVIDCFHLIKIDLYGFSNPPLLLALQAMDIFGVISALSGAVLVQVLALSWWFLNDKDEWLTVISLTNSSNLSLMFTLSLALLKTSLLFTVLWLTMICSLSFNMSGRVGFDCHICA